jgi:16S rRNA (uracil1498-N3)-methyltransferase
MARLYWPKQLITGGEILINERRQIHYLCDVLRLKVKDDVFIFDGQGNEYHCQIQGVSKKGIILLIKGKIRVKSQGAIRLAIACALTKQRSRFDDLVDKLSQLGVDKIIPMVTKRVIVRWNSNQRQRHHQRWRKIAQAACIQSDRNTLPIIEPIKGISEILTPIESYDLKLIPALIEKKQNLRDIVLRFSPRSILVLIGPEGDFTRQELIQAEGAGFIPICLGDLVLRVDTAAIAVAAFLGLYKSSK